MGFFEAGVIYSDNVAEFIYQFRKKTPKERAKISREFKRNIKNAKEFIKKFKAKSS